MVNKKNPVGAHYGLKDWMVQRISAVLMVLSAIVFLIALSCYCPKGFEEWQVFINLIEVRIAVLLFIFSLVTHAYIGMRDIYMDYIKWNGIRLLKTVGIFVYLFICLLWAMVILL